MLIQDILFMREIGHPEETLVCIIVLAVVTPMWLQLPIISYFGMRPDMATRAEPVRVRSPQSNNCKGSHGIANMGCRYPDIRGYY
jgi:hypothetical protein